MTFPTIPIPEDLKEALSDNTIKGKYLVLVLGVKYNNAKILITIPQQFSQFKDNIKKSLEGKHVEKQDITRIVSFIKENHQEFYPDCDDLLLDIGEGEGKPEKVEEVKPDITYDEWLSKLNEKYHGVKETCDKNFPDIWQAVEFALSVRNILHVKDITLPFAGIILGPPSSSKTLVLEMLRQSANTFYTDSFTPKSFVSHNTAASLEQLQKIDMLPKIKDKLFVAPEMAPIFSAKEEDLIQNLGIATRILDGHGYESDTGAYGHRGYNENIMFTWLGAAVDIPRKVYKHLANLGPKLYFFRMKIEKKSHDEFLRELKENNFTDRKNEVKGALLDYVKWFEYCPIGQVESNKLKIKWDSSKDDENALRKIVHLGELLAPLRGVAITWETRDTQSSDYAYYTPIVEHPSRAMTCLTNVSKGHALLTGRNYIIMDDIPILIKIVMSTAPIERIMIFDLLLRAKGKLTSYQIMDFLKISKPTALKTMTELRVLGLVDLTKDSEAENATQTIKLKDDFKWFLSEKFQKLREGFVPEGISKYDNNKDAKDSVKKNSPHIEKKILSDNENLNDDTSNPPPSLLKTTQDTREGSNEENEK
jgi:hypothetical protein